MAGRIRHEVPSISGWDTEQLNQRAGQQLKLLGQEIIKAANESAEHRLRHDWSSLLTESCHTNSLLPQDLETDFQDARTVVRRLRTEPTEEPSVAAVEGLPALAESHRWRRSKFKIIRVRKTDDRHFVTQALAHLSGSTRDGQSRVEINSTWLVEWESAAAAPRIARITRQDHEEVVWHGRPIFEDITGAVFSQMPQYARTLVPGIPELRERMELSLGIDNLGHQGIAIGDVNQDNLPDAYVCQTGGIPNHLLVQNPDGTVTDVAADLDVDYLDNSRAALMLDLDNDGDQDLVVTLASGMVLLENSGVAGFRERARLRSVRQGFSLSAADVNRDGRLDIYVCVYYSPQSQVSEFPAPIPYFDATNGGINHLIINDGNWVFHDGTEEAGLNVDNHRFSYASVWSDIDEDGDQDLLVVNDFGPNQLYRNQQGRFLNCAESLGLLDGAFGMGGSFGDVNRDGQDDIYIANMFSAAGNRVTTQPQFKPDLDTETRQRFLHLARGNSLFLAQSQGYEDVSVKSGVTVGRWSWGSLFADINNDGWEDLLVGNGYVTGKSKVDL